MDDRLIKLIAVAAGREKADLVIKNAKVINVFTQEVINGDIAVLGDKIAGIGCYEGIQEIDADGKYVAPGLIDSHVHIESSMVTPGEFARAVVPRGTTTVIADPHEIANVCGIDGIKYILEKSEGLPLSIFVMLPSCVPATPFESSGAKLEAKDLSELINDKRVLGLGELMNYPALVNGEAEFINKINMAAKKIKDGHAPGLEGKGLNAYACAGIKTDHECTTIEEMHARLRLGMYVQLREGSAAKDLETLLKGVEEENLRRCILCTDDRHLHDIIDYGHIDNNVRLAIKNGISPIAAVIMATINAAECYGLDGIGAIAPGYTADMIIIKDLNEFHIEHVFKEGKLVAKEGKALFEVNTKSNADALGTVRIKAINKEMLQVKIKSDVVNVIKLLPYSLATKKVERQVKVKNGFFRFDNKQDIAKLAVIERHNATGNVGLGLVEGFKIKNGAIASTVAHDSHNLLVIGDNDDDMLLAINEIEKRGGGITICSNGKVLKTLPLEIAGLITESPFEEVNRQMKDMLSLAYGLGVNKEIDPFMTLAFLALPVIPEIRVTDKGLFDVSSFSFIDQ